MVADYLLTRADGAVVQSFSGIEQLVNAKRRKEGG
jgi:hypothetical protein